jgi:hypothetical protein
LLGPGRWIRRSTTQLSGSCGGIGSTRKKVLTAESSARWANAIIAGNDGQYRLAAMPGTAISPGCGRR